MGLKHLVNKGDVFNRWTVLGEIRQNGKLFYEVNCTCGNKSKVESSHLVNGQSRSCGCLQRESLIARITKHNRAYSRTYKTWEMMVQRGNPNSHHFLNYKDKGIIVCKEWSESFENFLLDMGDRPEDKTLDRIDGSKGYFKENCRWACNTVQAINKGISSQNTSGVKGVSWSNNKKLWRAKLKLNGKVLLDRYFKDKESAASARKEAEEKYFKPLLEEQHV